MHEELMSQPLAFAATNCDEGLIAATHRLVFEAQDGEFLNIEVFGSKDSATQKTLLVFIPGVCESAETLGVQAIVAAASHITVAVLELPGHGLSTGKRCVIKKFDSLVTTVVAAVEFIMEQLNPDHTFLTGDSLGGVLAIYAAAHLDQLAGIATIAPAVGVAPQAVPHWTIVAGLKALAWLAPALQVPSLTPYEDPSQYNCPSNTQRNFMGHWPLATCRTLLEVTSHRVPNDNATHGVLTLKNISNMLVIAGAKDPIVPLQCIQDFYEQVESTNKVIKVVQRAGHDLLFQPKYSKQVTQALMDWLETSLQQRK
jgi:alpha-beta hydrolase superfamily lysophospholipase